MAISPSLIPIGINIASFLIKRKRAQNKKAAKRNGKKLDTKKKTSGSNKLSFKSKNSFLSLYSSNSMLSIGSAGSILSIGSIGSAGSVLSIGSALSLVSILSFASVASVMASKSFKEWPGQSDKSKTNRHSN